MCRCLLSPIVILYWQKCHQNCWENETDSLKQKMLRALSSYSNTPVTLDLIEVWRNNGRQHFPSLTVNSRSIRGLVSVRDRTRYELTSNAYGDWWFKYWIDSWRQADRGELVCADTETDVYFSSRFPAKLPNGLKGEEDESQTCRSAGMSPGFVVL